MRRETHGRESRDQSAGKISVAELVDWFNSEFENPVHHVPYETAEGGFQYYAGGPYDARDELLDHFPSAPDALIEQAARILEEEGTEWVRKGEY
jgi:hypothetical protein